MSENKRYFWLRLYDDFFTSKRIKKLRALAGGDTYTIIYLKMQLKAIKDDGYLYFDNIMNDFAEELALDIDESADDVRVTIQYLMSVGLLECSENGEQYFLTYLPNLIGTETASTQRSRDCRKRKKEQEVLQCNADATQVQHPCNAEIDIEKEIDKEIEKDIDNNPPYPPSGEWDANKHSNIANFDYLAKTEMRDVKNKELLTSLREWLAYKDNKKPKTSNHYQLDSIRKLANKFFEQAKEYGTKAVVDVVDSSIANNYQGITWDLLDKKPKAMTTQQKSMANLKKCLEDMNDEE